MKIAETHRDFGKGMNGRLTIRDDMGTVVDVIFTKAQRARRYCEDNPDTPEGKRFAAAIAPAAAAKPVPAPPALTGGNPENSALICAQRKLLRLYEAAQCAEPVQAVEAIRTTRGHKYLNTCDDYKKALLLHLASGC
jgi:hypothetical protein